ncbi:hypothetical protein R3Q08_26795 [Rhodococcus erythropolis]|uniref:NACHT domain-containing protein n=1 Tax=Rhodococcus erythropolis TaxID=1833 RepID=UPI0029495680|nr:hypothetical protein [Rhodococcus erythropolis]MDV6211875.1 hypothetical protein [Rhodococcus erythropolis]
MGYLYENSNPERFQHFCQSLITLSLPELQCFPIGQPDGGRDGWDSNTKTVLQVKFKRADDDESVEWMLKTLEKELPKIRQLADRGAENYIMATNARGTAHLGSGRIDKVQEWLDTNLPIRGSCFWRDELDRRFDTAPTSLKLKYSELLSLEDGIEVVLGEVLGSQNERQQDALRSFIAAQFETDKTVKFKQVSLSNDLLDLFIDVPIGFPRKFFERAGRSSSAHRETLNKLIDAITGTDQTFISDREFGDREILIRTPSGPLRNLRIGAAELFLGGAAQDHLKLVVLEGAPGQGKSTLAQYVCQIHRARYLNKQDLLGRVPEAYKQTAFRVPVKVDLRDYAAFLDGNSPFSSASSPTEPRTLDVFLAQLIAYNSGGIPFSAHDVLVLLKSAPVLLFLDGLDEVADLTAREALVASIGEALARWGEFDADFQVVVTSRPSVFGRAPSFGKFGFATLNLQNIDMTRINEYADKWVVARNLDPAEKNEVKKVLSEKLELAHIRDLTRNPMQLTILLSLIHQVGHSLPDQRTDLYGRYVDLFLTREADKSARVREHRQVLLEFIQHLAWILQTQSESSKSAGSISASELQARAREFLRDGGHATGIADDLFGGGLERIFVLVERIEGLYEFEVQPLREFFCAQYLYATAPVGTYRDKELRGDRAQRFEALAANPLWLNVCRFYAGSCERGETGTLVFSLEEMIRTGDLAVAVHARRVGLALIQDWVFSNVKYAQNRLIEAVFDVSGTQMLIAGEGRSIDELHLAVDCGRDTFRDQIFEQLTSWPVDTRTSALCSVLRINGGQDLSDEFCDLLVGKVDESRTNQLVRMFRAGAAVNLPPGQVWNLITEDQPEREHLLRRIAELVDEEPVLAMQIQELVDEFVRGVLGGNLVNIGHNVSALTFFANLLKTSSGLYLGLSQFGARKVGSGDENLELYGINLVPDTVRSFLNTVSSTQFDVTGIARDYHYDSPELWSSIVEHARGTFGETWATMSLAISIAGIRSTVELPEGADSLFDASLPLCSRARAARLRRGGVSWWLRQLELASTELNERLWVGLVLMWASAKNLYDLSEQINRIVESLDTEQYSSLRSTLVSVSSEREIRADRKKLSSVDLRPFSSHTAVLVAISTKAPSSNLHYTNEQGRAVPLRGYLKAQKEHEEIFNAPSSKDISETLAWSRQVNRLRVAGAEVPRRAEPKLRVETAEEVLKEPGQYPPELVSSAVYALQRRYRPKTLGAVARDQGWTFD